MGRKEVSLACMMVSQHKHTVKQGDLEGMISQEKRLMIRHYVKQGEPKAQVARRFGVCRQTVYNHLSCDVEKKPARKRRSSKLDPYRRYIRVRLEDYDVPATSLLDEIKEKGYIGSITILREFVHDVKERKVRNICERFETLPGHQAQIDWGECGTVVVDGAKRKLYVFALVLGYSRMLFACFTTSTKQHVLQSCLQEAFERVGIPAELLVDNMKQAVDAHTKEGVRFNRKFLDFCEHYGVVPFAAPPYWPRAKGKVERGVGYLKGSFLEGRRFTDVEDLNRQLEVWLDTVANVRVHGTTGERPCERWQREQKSLRAYEGVPGYDTRPVEVRKVMRDSYIRYGGVFYSVDPVAVGQSVIVKAASERIGDPFEVYLGSQLVASHRLKESGSPRVTDPDHERKIRMLTRGRKAVRGRRVKFEQILADGEELQIPVPEVQTRSLQFYEQLVPGGTS
jgi:transposase